MKSIEKKLTPWKGADNKIWTDTVSRAMVQAVIEIAPRGRMLTAKSQTIVNSIIATKMT
jgi:hypothetical protein